MGILSICDMSIKTKIMDIVAAHPKLVTFGIGMTITMAIGTAIGMVDHQAFANSASQVQGNGNGHK